MARLLTWLRLKWWALRKAYDRLNSARQPSWRQGNGIDPPTIPNRPDRGDIW